MAKPGYPGLVQVPPSDRALLKRRLAKWAFLILSVIGGVSSLNFWLPSSDRSRDCQPSADHDNASSLRRDCTQAAQIVAAVPSPRTEVLVSQRAVPEVRKRVPSSQSRVAMPAVATPSPKRPIEQPPAQPPAAQTTMTPPASPNNDTVNQVVASSHESDAAASVIDPPPVTNQAPAQTNPDLVLAEQGDAFAQYRLGRFYAQQNGSHSSESISWYMKSSDGLRRLALSGNGKAMYVLGVMYAFGRGVAQDKDESRNWLTQAVAHQIPAAGPVLASLNKDRPADPSPPMIVPVKRGQT
ncbi:MAG: sel1 repeat family protein [Nitrospira sp.]|nr:sel1 repeat family protein [Nitrospira sp.]